MVHEEIGGRPVLSPMSMAVRINSPISMLPNNAAEGECQSDDALADVIRVSLYSVDLDAAQTCQKLLIALEALTLDSLSSKRTLHSDQGKVSCKPGWNSVDVAYHPIFRMQRIG